MTKLSANRAAKEAGVAKKTLLEALENGRLSGVKNDKGHWEIDASELFRVFPKNGAGESDKTVPHPPEKTTENNALSIEVKMLREQMDKMEQVHDRERRQLTDQIDDFRSRLDEAQEQNKRLTTLIPMQATQEPQERRRGFWARLTG